MTAFITVDELRAYAKNARTEDEPSLARAVEVACGMVENGWTDSRGHHYGVGPVVTQTITDEYVEGGVTSARVATLTAVKDFRTGSELTVADYFPRGQMVKRRDGGWIVSPLLVSYTTGLAETADEAPDWAKSAALILGAWHLATRQTPGAQSGGEDRSLRPLMEAAELLSPHTLAPLGFA